MDKTEFLNLVKIAVRYLYKFDQSLLLSGASENKERNISARLGTYLAILVEKDLKRRSIRRYYKSHNKKLWVDCEYARFGQEPKVIYTLCKKCEAKCKRYQEIMCLIGLNESANNTDKDNEKDKKGRPDIICHGRKKSDYKTKQNYFIIEVKLDTSTASKDEDIAKLYYFVCQADKACEYQYKHGLSLMLSSQDISKARYTYLAWKGGAHHIEEDKSLV